MVMNSRSSRSLSLGGTFCPLEHKSLRTFMLKATGSVKCRMLTKCFGGILCHWLKFLWISR